MPVGEVDLAVDRELAEVAGLLPPIRYTTPVNTEEVFQSFIRQPSEPAFTYLSLPDLEEIDQRLQAVEPESCADPMLAHLTGIKKRELALLIDLLRARGTPEFFMASVELFGHVDTPLVDIAGRILDGPIEPRGGAGTVGPHEIARAAEAEIAHYRQDHPELLARVHVDKRVAGIRVENGDLYIGSTVHVPARRLGPLIQHEVGVHVLTYANGASQPLKLLAVGLPGYEENQEALGVLAEYLSGGLAPSRLRVLALRVMAAHSRSGGHSFVETYQSLRGFGAGKRLAFMTTMRSHRGGGMTRDAGYLRGFVRLLEHLSSGGDLGHLLVGKLRLEDEPLVDDLTRRHVLSSPPLTPRFLANPLGRRLLTGLRSGVDILELSAR